MIPNKLYIPTTTLNFNNIMSSESVSPVSFYINRRFGYKRFEKVAPNNLDNLILLYDKYPIFDVNDKDLENYPLVIEIDTRFLPEDSIQRKDDIFFAEKTIYITPLSSRIIFRTEAERRISLSKAEPSIESKLIPIYHERLVVLSHEIDAFEWHPINIEDLANCDNLAVSSDITINKLKGMLYGYLLGANVSSTKEVVLLRKMVKDLRNILAAILASPDSQATNFQLQHLETLYTQINRSFKLLSGVESRINEVISQKIEEYKSINFVEILKGEGFYQEWFRKQVSQLNLCCFQIQSFNSYKAKDKIAELDKYIDDIEEKIRFYDVKTKLEMSKLPIVQNCRIVDIPEQEEILSVILGEYKNEVWNKSEFLSSRYDFAKVGGKLCREKLGDKWDNSSERVYINSLLKNLNEYTAFDINSTNSIVLKSFAAFCQKGEGDIDKMRDYLISNGIGDFRIAFALWGLIFGFAEMPKTLTNDFYNNKDRKYVSDVYKYIYKQIHGIDLDGELGVKEFVKDEIKQKPSVNRRGSSTITISSKINDMVEADGNLISLSKNRTQDTVERIAKPMPEFLKKIQDYPEFKKMSAEAQEFYTKKTLEIYEGKEDKTFFDKLEKLSYEKTSTKWKKIVKSLKPKKQKGVAKNNTYQTSLGFGSESTGNFLTDYNFLLSNEEFISLVSNIKGWENDLNWFIDAHNPNHKDYEKYYKDKPTDNDNVIKQFIKLKNGKYKNAEFFLRKTYLK